MAASQLLFNGCSFVNATNALWKSFFFHLNIVIPDQFQSENARSQRQYYSLELEEILLTLISSLRFKHRLIYVVRNSELI